MTLSPARQAKATDHLQTSGCARTHQIWCGAADGVPGFHHLGEDWGQGVWRDGVLASAVELDEETAIAAVAGPQGEVILLSQLTDQVLSTLVMAIKIRYFPCL